MSVLRSTTERIVRQSTVWTPQVTDFSIDNGEEDGAMRAIERELTDTKNTIPPDSLGAACYSVLGIYTWRIKSASIHYSTLEYYKHVNTIFSFLLLELYQN